MKTTRNFLGAAASAVLAGLLAGCATTVATNPEVPRVSATPPPVSGQAVPDNMAAEASVEAVKYFNIQITAEGSDLAEVVRQSVEGRLADAGYKIAPAAPDIKVRLSVSSSVFDRSGGGGTGDNGVPYTGYVRYEGTVTADITRTWDGKKIGFTPMSIRGKRGLGNAEGQRNLTAQMVDQAAPVIVNAARPELTGLAVNDVVIQRPWLSSHDLSPTAPWVTSNDPEYIRNFIQYVKQQSGVIYCAMVAEDYHGGALTFRVVYLADAMPEGLVNRLLTVPQLKSIRFKQ